MNKIQEHLEKVKYLLIDIYEQNANSSDALKIESDTLKILRNSDFIISLRSNKKFFPNAIDIEILVTASIYTSCFNAKDLIYRLLKKRINELSQIKIVELNINPNFDKIEVINSSIHSVKTDWEDINAQQDKLIEIYKKSTDSVDFQNIGNSARTLMDKLSRTVFNPEFHTPKNTNIDLNKGKFKNQLKSFIEVSIDGKSNKEFRKLAKSSVEFVCNSIDLMNTTTHKLNAQKHMAELCVIGSLSTVRIIKIISEIK